MKKLNGQTFSNTIFYWIKIVSFYGSFFHTKWGNFCVLFRYLIFPFLKPVLKSLYKILKLLNAELYNLRRYNIWNMFSKFVKFHQPQKHVSTISIHIFLGHRGKKKTEPISNTVLWKHCIVSKYGWRPLWLVGPGCFFVLNSERVESCFLHLASFFRLI